MGLDGSYLVVRSQILEGLFFPILNQVYSLVNQEETRKGVNVNSAQICIPVMKDMPFFFFSGQRNANKFIHQRKKGRNSLQLLKRSYQSKLLQAC